MLRREERLTGVPEKRFNVKSRSFHLSQFHLNACNLVIHFIQQVFMENLLYMHTTMGAFEE